MIAAKRDSTINYRAAMWLGFAQWMKENVVGSPVEAKVSAPPLN